VILPTKHIPVAQSLLGEGAGVLKLLDKPVTLTRLWERIRTESQLPNYERFLLSLDLLYALDAIYLDSGFVKRKRP
jgi:hypothetical protein